MEECLRCLGSGLDIIFKHKKSDCPQCDTSLEIVDLITCPECSGTGQSNKFHSPDPHPQADSDS